MKVRIPALYQDAEQPVFKEGALAQRIELEEPYFLDGPISRRVAVVDFDPLSGELLPGAKLKPANGRKIREYDISPGHDVTPEFRAVMVFGTVCKTIGLFEHRQILGRPITWGFDGPQLLVVPRAGQWRNAFYERASRSLQFFYFNHAGTTVYTSLSEDIVTHETGHAILDGIAPDLYDAVTPQALAIHESVADLVALVRAMANDKLRDEVLRDPNWSITQTNQFTALAEEFGKALSEGRSDYLRNAYNEKRLIGEGAVSGTEPHGLAEVLTGALYAVLVADYRRMYDKAREDGLDDIPARGKALGTVVRRFERFVFRALDYLPPGDVTFADFVRAVLAADLAAYPDDLHDPYREELRRQALDRGIVLDDRELALEVQFEHPAVTAADLDLASLVESNWHAHEFVTANRELFAIPPDHAFELRPRLEVTREFARSGENEVVDELIMKVSWDAIEDNDIGSEFPSQRAVTMGTTLVIDRSTKLIRARLTTDRNERHAEERSAFLARLADEDVLVAGDASAPDGRPLRGTVGAKRLGGVMMVSGAACTLHIAGSEGAPGVDPWRGFTPGWQPGPAGGDAGDGRDTDG